MFSGIPFLKLFFALAIGVILAVFLAVEVNLVLVVFVFAFLFLFHLLTNKYIKLVPFSGAVFLLLLVLIGLYRGGEEKQKAKHNHLQQDAYIIAEVIESPKIYDKIVRTRLEIIAIKGKDNFKETQGKSLLTLEKDSLAISLVKGDYIQFEPDFKEITTNKNPNTFNYKRYLFFHLISQQTYLKSNKWNKIEAEKYWYDIDRLSSARTYLLQQYKKYGIDGVELSVLSALTLGYKNELDKEIQKSYAASGAIHVLAVSGLHVGIVFVIISQLLRFFGSSKLSRYLRFVLSVLFIWFFAFLTGAAPSVLRASLMFSFIAFGQLLERNSTIYNSIFASAFFLLLYNPFLLFDLSFQLSYSAVISIVYFQPKIGGLYKPKFAILKWLWGLVSVSLAAQIGTIPIVLYYFHQFPNYFLLSNFVVIPMATIVIWLSLLFFLSLSFPFVAAFIAKIITYLISFQNLLIQKVEALPYALTTDIYLDKLQLLFLVLLVLLLMLLSYKFSFRNLLILLASMLILVTYSGFIEISKDLQRKLVVYDIRGQTAINLIDGRDNILISSMSVSSKTKTFNLENNWLSMGLEKEKHINSNKLSGRFSLSNMLIASNINYFSKDQFIQFYNKRILFFNDKKDLERFKPIELAVDYLILAKNTRIDLAELSMYFDIKQLIIDASHSGRNLQFWKTQSVINPNIKIHIVAIDGPFITDL